MTAIMTNGCVPLLFNSSWKRYQLAAEQLLIGQTVWYGKAGGTAPSVTVHITPAGSLSPSWAKQDAVQGQPSMIIDKTNSLVRTFWGICRGEVWRTLERNLRRYFLTFKEPRNQFQGIGSASLCNTAGQHNNPIPTRFLAPVDCSKIPALDYIPLFYMYQFSTVVHWCQWAKGLCSAINEVNLQGLKQYAVSFVQHCVGIEWNYIRKSVCRPREETCPEFNWISEQKYFPSYHLSFSTTEPLKLYISFNLVH